MSVTINGTTGINNSGSDSASAGYTGTLTGNASTASAPATGSTLALQSAKAWVNFNGTTATPSTIRSSYNISSITKNGTGDWTVNFTNATADANYTVAGSTTNYAGYGFCVTVQPITQTTTNLRFNVASTYGTTGGVYDNAQIELIIFGN